MTGLGGSTGDAIQSALWIERERPSPQQPDLPVAFQFTARSVECATPPRTAISRKKAQKAQEYRTFALLAPFRGHSFCRPSHGLLCIRPRLGSLIFFKISVIIRLSNGKETIIAAGFDEARPDE